MVKTSWFRVPLIVALLAASPAWAQGQAEPVVTGSGQQSNQASLTATALPDIVEFVFHSQQTEVLPGGSAEHADGWNCDGKLSSADQVGRMAVVSTHYQNGCYTDGQYNHREYRVDRGLVTGKGGTSYEGYRLHGPNVRASKFLGSRHFVFYRFAVKQDYSLYELESGNVVKRGEVPASQTNPDAFVRVEIELSSLSAAKVYFFAPSSQPQSPLTRIGPHAEGARLKRTALGDAFLYRYKVVGTPFDTGTGFDEGPGTFANTYSYPRQFFMTNVRDNNLAIIWQDKKTMSVQVTLVGEQRRSTATRMVANADRSILAAATSDGHSVVFLLFVGAGDGEAQNLARTARLMRMDLYTGATSQVALDTSKNGLDITTFGTRNVGSMAYASGQLGLIISRTKHRSDDGLNHQGGISAVFDASTLALLQNHGQTSGHSFESVLEASTQDGFVGVDLGDNYPRGLHLHRFDAKRRDSAVVYTFKTEHGAHAANPAGRTFPKYSQISGNGTTRFKWSNDNRTYTELGGVVEDLDGYTVVFSGEGHAGRSLDNSRTGAELNDSRNLALVRVGLDFGEYSSAGNVVSDALVLTQGIAETGGFYTFNGDWAAQRNTGVVWLTNYKDPKLSNASRVKAIGVSGGILILWEEWTPSSYRTTHGMKVDVFGKVLAGPVTLGPMVRLGRRDEVWVQGNDVYTVVGNGPNQTLDLVMLRIK